MSKTTPTISAVSQVQQATASEAAPATRLLRIADVCHATGLGRATIYNKTRAGTFPGPVQLHGACVAWIESEVTAWILARPRAMSPVARHSRARVTVGVAA